MTSLSEHLKKGRSTLRQPMPDEPVAVLRACASIARTWPGIEIEPTEEDPEQLVRDVERRRRTGNWSDFYWADLDRASRALIDNGLWRNRRHRRLLQFLLDQVRPGVNRPYLRTLIRKYLETFDPRSTLTRKLAPVLKAHWREAKMPVEPLVTQFRIFDPEPAPSQVIASFMIRQENPFAALRGLGVEAPHGPGLMASAHSLFLSTLAPRIATGESAATRRLLSWLNPEGEHAPLEGPGAAQALDVLLLPWERGDPDSDLRHLIEARLLAAYGDPRIESTGFWSSVCGRARRVILRWLASSTIQVFFDIVTQADRSHMWSDRKRLWMDLVDENLISEAWFALSENGSTIADRLYRENNETPLAYARNRSRLSQDRRKCLLIMNVQGHWVVEGAHDFPTWVFPPGDVSVLTPYASSYTCEQIRDIRGSEQPKRIRHDSQWRNNVITALRR
ncbi:MAG: EH signature domain-containing protein [Alphaproteobacteria bacterium]|nr:EH signature domain-containing protein [Alphaproteobacteria bacterium]